MASQPLLFSSSPLLLPQNRYLIFEQRFLDFCTNLFFARHTLAVEIYYDIRSASGEVCQPASQCFASQLWLISRPIRTAQPFPSCIFFFFSTNVSISCQRQTQRMLGKCILRCVNHHFLITTSTNQGERWKRFLVRLKHSCICVFIVIICFKSLTTRSNGKNQIWRCHFSSS